MKRLKLDFEMTSQELVDGYIRMDILENSSIKLRISNHSKQESANRREKSFLQWLVSIQFKYSVTYPVLLLNLRI